MKRSGKQLREAGEMYCPEASAELNAEYRHAAECVFKFNNVCFTDSEKRSEILHSLLGKAGKKCTILSPFHCDFGYNIKVGENFFANTGLVVLDEAEVNIGDNVLIGPQVGIYTAYHALDITRRRKGYEAASPVTICDDVWIGGHSCILPGVTIGKGSVIGAGSVVNRDIPEMVVAAGNPCRVIRKLVPEK